MPAYVVPVDVGGCGGDGPVCQPGRGAPDITYAQACVDQQTSLPAAQKVAVGLLPVALLADAECVPVKGPDGKPAVHGATATPQNP